jgi:ubiquitin-protein ligase
MQDLHSTRLREEFKRMLHNYDALLPGAEGTPYEGGVWKINVVLPPEYPFKPVIANFITPIWHPNVAVGGRQWQWGSNVCLSLINWHNQGKLGGWKETITLPTVVEHIAMMLQVYWTTSEMEFPEYLVDPRDPFNPEAGQQMLNNFELFYNTAREWTEKYARGTKF